MKLAQILIEAGVTPDDLPPDCMFIAQDGEGPVFYYDMKPLYFNIGYAEFYTSCGLLSEIKLNLTTASDQKTPLSREQFIADYEAHND